MNGDECLGMLIGVIWKILIEVSMVTVESHDLGIGMDPFWNLMEFTH